MLKVVALLALAALAQANEAQYIKNKVETFVETTGLALETDVENYTGTARWTYYESYPRCCPHCGNYDPHAPKDECEDDSGCDYCGDFADDTHESLNWVKNNNIVSFFDAANPGESAWRRKYAGKKVKVTRGSVSFIATVKDTCADSDCKGCCTKNAGKYGFVVDMEYYTVLRYFGKTDIVDGPIQFQFL
jgi:hypothetical protein